MSIDIKLAFTRADFTLDLDISLSSTSVTAVFGRSGSGKTTLLRCIAGLERGHGEVTVNGEAWQSTTEFLPVHQRALGYVFQQGNLFPHLSVGANLLYGFKRIPEQQRTIPLDEAITLLGLDGLLNRMPHQLSGGQQQRVAIARALLSSPRLLLLDEPLSNLDDESKNEILTYIEQLNRNLSLPIIYVSHSASEVTRLADDIVLLEEGRVVASGVINALLTNPELPLAYRDDASAVLSGTVTAIDSQFDLSTVDVGGSGKKIFIARSNIKIGYTIRIQIYARDVSLALVRPEQSSIQNILPGSIVSINDTDEAAQVLIKLNIGGQHSEQDSELRPKQHPEQHCLARITRRAATTLNLQPGTDVFLQIKTIAVIENYH